MGKWALITGASGGIGREIALALAKKGWNLYLHYNQGKKKLEEITSSIETSFELVQADLSLEAGPHILLNQLKYPIDAIIHNSGESHFGLITDVSDEMAKEFIQLHTISPFIITKNLLQSMINKKQGNIIFITSIWGLTGASCEVMYSMVKGAQNTFVKALAKEVAPSGIKVNGIAPGAINTNMLGNFNKEDIAMIEEEIPMGRLGKPEEIADVVLYLLSKQSSYINGQIISVNGAWYT